MKTSIIIPVFNCEKFLEEAIRSALYQEDAESEVIVVDDGSTDGSLAVANKYKGFITIISQPNSGVAAARNHGARIATGECLLFLDCDDWIDSNYLAETVPLMQNPQVGIVSTDMQRFGLRNDRVVPTGTTLSHELYSNDLPVTSLIRREAFPGYRKLLCNGAYADWCLWIDILKQGWQVATTSTTLFHYRVSTGTMASTTHGHEADLIAEIRSIHRELYTV